MYKIFKHRKLPCIPCFGETQIKLQWYNIFFHLFSFFDFATQLVFTPVSSSNLRNQAPLFTELHLSQATSFWHSRGHQTTPFSKNVSQLLKTTRKNFPKMLKNKKRGFSLPWSPHQDYNDQKRVPTLIKPAQQVKLTVFSKKRSYAKNVIFSGFSTKN